MKKVSIQIVVLVLFVSSHSWSQVFSNTTAAACNSWDSGNAYTGFQRSINVSGLPSSLSASGTVLQQVNLELGSPSCLGNLSSYYARLISPSGTIIQLFSPFVTTSTSQWMDIKLRDDTSLEPVSTYSTTTQQGYWPWSIGYYRIPTVDGFSSVNGEDPNGTWILQIAENTSSEVSFVKVDLVFGPIITVNNVTGSTANNDCTQATCIDGLDVVRATNNGYSTGDPNYPGSPVSGCSWNGANNNSSWFMFQATGATAYMTVSGMYNSSAPTSADMQLLVVKRSGSDCTSGTFTVPSGGCPDDQTTNNTDYISPNGGSSSTNVYSNGITANCEFNISGLTAGEMYYLYVDGNGGAPSSFYIEVNSGAEDCGVVLPIDLIYFTAVNDMNLNQNIVKWATLSESNSDYFSVEYSSDGMNFNRIANMNAAGNSTTERFYEYEHPITNEDAYYRLVLMDKNGNQKFYGPVFVPDSESSNIVVSPNPSQGNFIVSTPTSKHLTLINSYGAKIAEFDVEGQLLVDYEGIVPGIYLLSDGEGNQVKILIGQ